MAVETHLILTVDYEVFGNGSGCVNACVLAPSQRMLAIANRFSAHLSFFVEALEFDRMQRIKTLQKPVQAIQRQLRSAVQQGHDVQLHLHPQWLDADHTASGWRLNFEKWRTGNLDTADLERALADAKSWLLATLQATNPSWRCLGFRAGGWCIQPSAQILPVLQRHGLRIESSVAPGLRHRSQHEGYDFTQTPNRPCWCIEQDVCQHTGAGLLYELPIATAALNKWRHGQNLLQTRKQPWPSGCCGSYQGADTAWQRRLGQLEKLRHLGWAMLDFSTLPAWALIDITRQWRRRYADFPRPLPVVAIAHSKNFTTRSERALSEYLQWAQAEPDILFSSYGRWLEATET